MLDRCQSSGNDHLSNFDTLETTAFTYSITKIIWPVVSSAKAPGENQHIMLRHKTLFLTLTPKLKNGFRAPGFEACLLAHVKKFDISGMLSNFLLLSFCVRLYCTLFLCIHTRFEKPKMQCGFLNPLYSPVVRVTTFLVWLGGNFIVPAQNKITYLYFIRTVIQFSYVMFTENLDYYMCICSTHCRLQFRLEKSRIFFCLENGNPVWVSLMHSVWAYRLVL